MSRSDIQSWVNSAKNMGYGESDSEDFTPAETVVVSDAAQDWQAFTELSRRRLTQTSTKSRIHFLANKLLSVARRGELDIEQALEVFLLLALTYPRYIDAGSRGASVEVLRALICRDAVLSVGDDAPRVSGLLEKISKWISNESTRLASSSARGSSASSERFVLLTWVCSLLDTSLRRIPSFPDSPVAVSLVSSACTLFDSLCEEGVKQSVTHSALVQTRRLFRHNYPSIPAVIKILLVIAKSAPVPLSISPLLGVCVDVSTRLKPEVNRQKGIQYIKEAKIGILLYYTSSVVMSRTPVPLHVLSSLSGFIANSVDNTDFSSVVFPTFEKGLIRSPEVSMSVLAHFLKVYSQRVPTDELDKITIAIMNTSKSANPVVRSASIEALGSLVLNREISDSELSKLVSHLLLLPKTGKTASADHRQALYSMLACIPSRAAVSSVIAFALPALLAKESGEVVIPALRDALALHLTYVVRQQQDLKIPPDVISVFSKELSGSKANLRRAFFHVIGLVLGPVELVSLFATSSNPNGNGYPSFTWSRQSLDLAEALFPALESNIKAVTSNPLNTAMGPLEGYVIVATFLHPNSPLTTARRQVLQDLVALAGPKSSFLLWDKVYSKLTSEHDELWFIQALACAFTQFESDVLKNEHLRLQFGTAWIHVTTMTSKPAIRRAGLSSLKSLTESLPRAIHATILGALVSYTSRLAPSVTVPIDESPTSASRQGRFSSVLLAIATFGDQTKVATRELLMAQWTVLAHHECIASSRPLWIEATQSAGLNPRHVLTNHSDMILNAVFDAALVRNVIKSLPNLSGAALSCITTVAFVAPELVIPRTLSQIEHDLDPARLGTLLESDLGIWRTPEGEAFIDVLANRKDAAVNNKGKDRDIEKWEAEVRKSIASKKAQTSTTLSKQDRALLDAQLRAESQVRSKVQQVKLEAERGLGLVRSLVASHVSEFDAHVSSIIKLFLSSALRQAAPLVGKAAWDTYLSLAEACSERLGTFRAAVATATLRLYNIDVLSERYLEEPLADLVLRVLYGVHHLSSSAAFDPMTFSLFNPLLERVLYLGGAGQPNEEGALEQTTLAIEIVQSHVPEMSIPAYPRFSVLQVILSAMSRYPQLAKMTSSVLIDLAYVTHRTASLKEISILIRGILVQESFVRHACLQALQPFDLTELDWSPIIWIACYDNDEQCAQVASSLWEENALDVPKSFIEDLVPYLSHEFTPIRTSCAASISEALSHHPDLLSQLLVALKTFYQAKAIILGPEYDSYGMLVERALDSLDPWTARQAIGQTFERLADSISESEIVPLFGFMIHDEALGDRHQDVRQQMLTACSAIVDAQGKSQLPHLLAIFETYLAQKPTSSETSDHIREAVVILLGRLARHLEASDPRIPLIVDRLVDALKTPSEAVQSAVADCLAPLAIPLGERLGPLIESLMTSLTSAHKYGERRGAAYGIAGLVHGRGLATFKEHKLLHKLRDALDDKKNYEARQGALFAFETMSTVLGRLFEPYITQIVPLLLASFGDGVPDVREATQDSSRVIMANMSGYCVKAILPSLLEGLDEKQWRTKKGSIELLGSMAYLAPKQLSISLPTVIPRLTGVLTDSHAQVRAAANKSLKQFGEVINNPEVRSLVPVLLKALVDPDKIGAALTALLKKSFVHYIDSPSLALLIPILERGMRDRGSEYKRKAAQIVGNLASLTDSKDFVPYLPRLVPLVHVVLVDPVPEARATSAKALGSLIERLGEANFPDLVSRLLQTLKTDTSGVDRQGAAQGLSEVLSGLGIDRMEALLPEVITNASSPRPYVREGFMSLLVFLPATFGHRFAPHLSRIIPPILNGLADSEEYVRTASMKAGRMIINGYSSKAVDLLLPELERGMFDSSWRIRHSSVTLVGELLYKVSGISGKNEIDEDESGEAGAAAAENSRKALGDVLGRDRRDRILGSLYIVRQDAISAVRQASIHIWKALVHNTPRTVREILSSLINQIVALLSEGEDQRETAARTMGELCRKLGEKILGEIVPILRRGSESPDSSTREGICFAIGEVLENTTEIQREGHEEDLIAAIRTCLVDESSRVRVAAAQAFDVLQEYVGGMAIDQTIPTLLEALRRPGASSGTALQALREIMTVRASTVFPILIPTLITSPITVFNANALASLVTVAGSALSKRLAQLLAPLVQSLETEKDEAVQTAVKSALAALVGSVGDLEGLHSLMMLLLGWCKAETPLRRASGATTFAVFCENTDLDFSDYRVDWVRQLVTMLDDSQTLVNEAAWHSLDEFVKSIDKEEMNVLVVPLRRTIESMGAPGRNVPGFGLAKGVGPLLPIIFAGLTSGNNEQREHAAYAIADVVERTEESAIRSYTTQLTGPLIRVITQATTSPPPVKSGILAALTVMLEKIPQFVKPFFPQLQRTFVKSLVDASLSVRNKASTALTVLMRHQPRVDPLITELLSTIRSSEEPVAGSVASALAGVITSARQYVGSGSISSILDLVNDAYRDSHEDPYNLGISEVVAALGSDSETVQEIIESNVLGTSLPHPLSSQIMLQTVRKSPNIYYELNCVPALVKKIQASISTDQPWISRPAREAKDVLRSESPWIDDEHVHNMF